MAENSQDRKYTRSVIQQNDHFEIVQIDWNRESISVMHNHGWSQCLVLIEDGTFQNTVDLGMKTEVQLLEKGQVLNTPIAAEHKMKCLTTTGRTLHVYTPRINELSEGGHFGLHLEQYARLDSDLKLKDPTGIDQLRGLLQTIEENSISTHSPYFMNQLFSGVTSQNLLAEEVIARCKTTLATHEASPVFSKIESEVVERLGELIGWPEGRRDGVSVPGGSAANFMAIHCARQKAFPELKTKGLSGAPPLKIFVSNQAHYSFQKACVAMGIGSDHLIQVDVDDCGRMRPEHLDQILSQYQSHRSDQSAQNAETAPEQQHKVGLPLLVSATAGTTVLGAFDHLGKIAEVCKKHGVWFHVDAAWGGPALFSEKLKPLMNGIELADSVTFDAHKLFGASLTCSYLLTRHRNLLLEANDVSGADYLFHSGVDDINQIDRGKMSWQCGRRADSLSFWSIWKSLGTNGLGGFCDRLLSVRDESIAWIRMQPRLDLIHEPEYLNICVRIKPPTDNLTLDANQWSKTVRERLKNENLAFVNYSTDSQGHFLRMILANPKLQFSHVQQILLWALEVK